MKFEKFNISNNPKKVLIAPLDWGLGHATRCIPIIYELLQLNCEVIIAADGKTKNLLQKEFPKLIFLTLRGYKVRYSRFKLWLPLTLFVQIPKILATIYYEHSWLKKTIQQYNIDAVISDNRLGMYHAKIPAVYITHQLTIKTGNTFTQWLAQKIHYHFINKYTTCWVPDNAEENNLAGQLSHPRKLPNTPIIYLGCLSRFEKIDVEKKYDILLLLSGPEPQRTLFEDLLLAQIKNYNGKVLIVRGLPGNKALLNTAIKQIEIQNHLDSKSLNIAIQKSNMVICRSGYTTIMDLIKLQQKAILVATPGQTEQEYLSKYVMHRNLFLSYTQKNFCIPQALQAAHSFSFNTVSNTQQQYKTVIEKFITSIKASA
jgi:uncharacterized protein (TIGR00661 family)